MAAESALKQLARANHIEPTAEGVRILEDVDASELRVDFDEIDRRREIAHEQVENVADYASSSACCQAALLEHFGSEPAFGERCGHCSNCAPPPAYAAANAESLSQTVATRDDPKTVLEKVLSGVARARGRRGASAVAGMLVGSRAKPVLEADFDELSTYGILDDIRNKDASYLIELMGRHGLIRRNEYGCVLLTEAGWEVVRGDRAPPDALAAALERSVRDPSELPTGRRSSGSAGTGETYRRTLELHRQGLSVEEVAERRDLTARTIRNHVVTLAARGEDLDLEVDPERLETLRGVASDWTNGDRLRPLKDALPDDWSYPMLKRHLAALLQERESSR